MNDRKRQQQKAMRMIAMSAKHDNGLLIPRTLMPSLAEAIRGLGEAITNCANSLRRMFDAGRIWEIFESASYKEGEKWSD